MARRKGRQDRRPLLIENGNLSVEGSGKHRRVVATDATVREADGSTRQGVSLEQTSRHSYVAPQYSLPRFRKTVSKRKRYIGSAVDPEDTTRDGFNAVGYWRER